MITHKNFPFLLISVLIQDVIMKCSVDVLIYLTDLYTGVPHHTPQRYKFIHSLLADAFHSLREGYVVDVPGFDVDDGRTLKTMDDITPDFIAAYNEHAHKFKSKFTPNKCHVFMPSELFCCGKSIKMNVRYATVKVYHVDSVEEARSYHGTCKSCKKIYLIGKKSRSKVTKFLASD